MPGGYSSGNFEGYFETGRYQQMSHQTYTVLLEQARDGGWSAHVPDLPTILVGADTRDEAAQMAREAIALHVEDMREQGLSVPEPHTFAVGVDVAA
jgi:predicted RNase H-like HicB family nuclease